MRLPEVGVVDHPGERLSDKPVADVGSCRWRSSSRPRTDRFSYSQMDLGGCLSSRLPFAVSLIVIFTVRARVKVALPTATSSGLSLALARCAPLGHVMPVDHDTLRGTSVDIAPSRVLI